jgi:phage shock protein PspC (stress-responsive transcriptional regulator)
METGRVTPRPSTLKMISEVLGPMPVSEPRDDRGDRMHGFRETLGRWTSAFRNPKGEEVMKKQNMLQQLARSRKDRKIAGICGGLGEHTEVPAWFWRLLFIAAVFAHGAGALVYLAAWIFMPLAKEPSERARPGTAGWLQLLTRSAEDRRVGGVCGGLGAATAVPSWLWRMGFVAALFFYGAGIILYALLWISIPKEGAVPARAGRPTGAGR